MKAFTPPFTRPGLARALWLVPIVLLGPATLVAQPRVSYQETQGISPAFEGWMENGDGSFEIVFGYMNRNWEEEIQVPVGPGNYFSLVDVGILNDIDVDGLQEEWVDSGQPAYFLPRRNRFVFGVTVPASFSGSGQELVWTLSANGDTERAYGSLARDYRIDNMVIMSETGSLGAGTSNDRVRSNEPPEFTLEGPTEIQARVGESILLSALVTDDGIPGGNPSQPPRELSAEQQLQRALREPRRITVGKTDGLHLSWFVYRGSGGAVEFDPPQVKVWEDTRAFANSPWGAFWSPPILPEDDRYETSVSFSEPGTYVLRGRADDGGLFTDVDVVVVVSPGTI